MEGWSAEDIEEATAAAEAEAVLEESPQYREVKEIFGKILEMHDFTGRIEAFGSYRSGFKTGGSDIDVVYLPSEQERKLVQSNELTPTMMLQQFAVALASVGCRNFVPVFQASMPLLKCVCANGADVDLCVSNDLGLHNSKLMAAYAGLDPRVTQVGQQVKQFAKFFDITCSSDGHLNSYAFTLMTIYYLMYAEPPVVPNLQVIAASVDKHPVMVKDQRWGCADQWDCQFFADVNLIPRGQNKQSVGELVVGFFKFYESFDWQKNAVSIRLGAQPDVNGGHPLKEGLLSTQGSNVWYIEDPFDLKHNLAALSTAVARQRIQDKIREALDAMQASLEPLQALARLCPQDSATKDTSCYLKCRVQPDKISKTDFVNYFSTYPVLKLFWPVHSSNNGRMEAFLMFASDTDRRITHAVNENFIGHWQVRLLSCSTHALADARRGFDGPDGGPPFEEIEGPGPNAVAAAPLEEVDQATQISQNMRYAQTADEVSVLVQRAKALDLRDAVKLGNGLLRQWGKSEGRSRGERRRGPSDDYNRQLGQGGGNTSDSAADKALVNAVSAGSAGPAAKPKPKAGGTPMLFQ